MPAVAGEGKRSKKKRKLRVLEGGRGGVGEGRRPPAEGAGGTGGQGQGQGKTDPPQGFPAGPPGRSASGPPAPFPHPTRMAVLTPASPAFAAARAACYAGFEHDGADAFPEALHAETERALASMSAAGLFHYDIVSAGKAVSSTFCERTLLGNAGMTYHYQRLRIFAYPWGAGQPPSPHLSLSPPPSSPTFSGGEAWKDQRGLPMPTPMLMLLVIPITSPTPCRGQAH